MSEFIEKIKISKKCGLVSGFTLAEVLITLGIIGIVAAMTIPVIQAKIEMKQHEVALKKIYSELSQAVSQMQNPDTWVDIPSTNDPTGVRDAFDKVLQYSKKDNCINIWGEIGYNNPASKYRNYKGTAPAYMHISNGSRAVVLKNGMFMGFTSGYRTTLNIHEIYVDTNGSKLPNMLGMDVHKFVLLYKNNHYKLLPIIGSPEFTYWNGNCSAGSSSWTTSWPCTYLMLTNPDKMP